MSTSKGTEAKDEIQARLALLRSYLERHYRIAILRMERLDRAVYRTSLQDGRDCVVRIFPQNRSVERAHGDAEVLNFLERSGFPAERCAAREPVTSPGGRAVMLTDYIEGQQAAPTEQSLRKYGELIGRLNELSGGPAREAGSLHHYTVNEGLPRNEINAALSWLDEIEDQVPTKSKALFDSLRSALLNADDLSDLPRALIHPDPVLKNLIVTRGGEHILIDWTGAGVGPRIASIGLLIWSTALDRGAWSPSRIEAVATGYRSRITLCNNELKRLANAMNLRPMIFAAFRYRHSISIGKIPEGNEWWWHSDELANEIAKYAQIALRAHY